MGRPRGLLGIDQSGESSPLDGTLLPAAPGVSAETLPCAKDGGAAPTISATQTAKNDPHNFARIQRPRISSNPTRRIPSAALEFRN